MTTPSGATAPLEGVGVLVTRPAHQAETLCELIEQQGGKALRFPVLDIVDPIDTRPLMDIINRLERYDCAVFISANAVNRALTRILARREWPSTVKIAVIGKRSAAELEHFGLRADLCPRQEFNSEALLRLEQMHNVSGKRFVIFRGDGGREYLADTLRERGAIVDYVEAYRRVRPEPVMGDLLMRWRAGEVNIVVVNSNESLHNLFDMLGDDGRPLLVETPLLVVSERMIPLAQQLGLREPPQIAENATDQAVLKALLAWKQFHC
ncbi:uroporphyrinogen-III synthase [Thiogranum longum]